MMTEPIDKPGKHGEPWNNATEITPERMRHAIACVNAIHAAGITAEGEDLIQALVGFKETADYLAVCAKQVAAGNVFPELLTLLDDVAWHVFAAVAALTPERKKGGDA